MSISRRLVKSLNKFKSKYPILAVTGPRQSGKTTLIKNNFPNYIYISLEDPDMRQFALEDTREFLKKYDGQVIFDEVQRVPELFSYLQSKVDEDKKMGQYILSGSQNFYLMSGIRQSLAGRVALLKLFPFDITELESADLLPSTFQELMVKGSYPAIYDRSIPSRSFYKNYIETYIERDIPEILDIRNIAQFRLFLSLCAARMASELNLNDLARSCQITAPTAKSWLTVLESSYILFQLKPYFRNFNKRIIKSPKIYFYDTGLASYLLGLQSVDDVDLDKDKGKLFENLVVSEIFKSDAHNDLDRDWWFWRTSHGKEIDLLRENRKGYNVYEIKSSTTIKSDYFRIINQFAEIANANEVLKTLIYGGSESYRRSGIEMIGWKDVVRLK